MQSKGWPFIAVTWGLLDFGLLHGSSPFVSSWLYWQDIVSLFNEANPGYVTCIALRAPPFACCWDLYSPILTVYPFLFFHQWIGDTQHVEHPSFVCCSVRWSGGRNQASLGGFIPWTKDHQYVLQLKVDSFLHLIVAQNYTFVSFFTENHSDDLQKVYKKILFLMDVATLARNMKMNPSYRRRQPNYFGMNEEDFYGMLQRTAEADDEVKSITNDAPDSTTRLNESDQRNLSESHRRTMLETLGAWYVFQHNGHGVQARHFWRFL